MIAGSNSHPSEVSWYSTEGGDVGITWRSITPRASRSRNLPLSTAQFSMTMHRGRIQMLAVRRLLAHKRKAEIQMNIVFAQNDFVVPEGRSTA
ncbi:hypothetical protein [Burkholderia gladioli]|uniref:hypothetical protein n=1 Tax=Burkholderia gladioli TaxID=28095 RepID=UPI003A5C44E9